MRRLPTHCRQLRGLCTSTRPPQPDVLAVARCMATERQLSSHTASTSGHSRSALWTCTALPLLGLAAAGSVSADDKESVEQEGFHLLPLATRQRIFFKYEKRIRDKSPLDKVFEYFSSCENDQQKFLMAADLVRAVVPTYPPSESDITRSGSLDGERTSGIPKASQTSFSKQFDMDGNGLICYREFLLVLTLLSIREADVATVFDVVDLDSGGDIDRTEFLAVMDALQARARVHAAKVGRSHKLSYGSESGLIVSFFGRDGTRRLSLPQFRDFLARLHEQVVRLEFRHYDVSNRGSIPATDFARSLVAAADVRQVDRLLDKVDALPPALAATRISLGEFLQLHRMQRGLTTLAVALEFMQQVGRPVRHEDFRKLVLKLLGLELSAAVVEVVFAVFGDEGGALDVPAFLEVMQRREIMWARRKYTDPEAQAGGVLKRAVACFKKCVSDEAY